MFQCPVSPGGRVNCSLRGMPTAHRNTNRCTYTPNLCFYRLYSITPAPEGSSKEHGIAKRTMNPLCKMTTGALPEHACEGSGYVTTAEVISNPTSSVEAAGRLRLSTPHGGCQFGEAFPPTHRPAIPSRSVLTRSIQQETCTQRIVLRVEHLC